MTQPPIPVPDPDAEVLTFRSKFLTLWLAITLAGLALGLPVGFIFTPPKNLQHLLLAIGNSAAAGIVLAFIIIALTLIKIDANVLRSHNRWAQSVQVQWHEISAVKRNNFLMLSYLQISTPYKKNIIQLPLFLTDPYGFRDAVARFTPPDHPLRLALEKEFPK